MFNPVESSRHQLLRLRHEQPQLLHAQRIPLDEVSIRASHVLQATLQDREKQRERDASHEERQLNQSKDAIGPGLGMQRLEDFITAVRKKIAQKVQTYRQQIGLTEADDSDLKVIKEVGLPQFAVEEGPPFWHIFLPRRGLRPKRQDIATISDSSDSKSWEIYVQLVRANNLPIREEVADAIYKLGLETAGRSNLSHKRREELQRLARRDRLVAVASASFQKTECFTDAAEGPNPQWGQSFSLPLRVVGSNEEQRPSPEALSKLEADLHVCVYDEVTIVGDVDSRHENSTFTHKERRFVGSFTVPFSTILMQKRLEGLFVLKRPWIVSGYRQLPPRHELMHAIEDNRDSERRDMIEEYNADAFVFVSACILSRIVLSRHCVSLPAFAHPDDNCLHWNTLSVLCMFPPPGTPSSHCIHRSRLHPLRAPASRCVRV